MSITIFVHWDILLRFYWNSHNHNRKKKNHHKVLLSLLQTSILKNLSGMLPEITISTERLAVFTTRQWSCGKGNVFSCLHLSFCLSTGVPCDPYPPWCIEPYCTPVPVPSSPRDIRCGTSETQPPASDITTRDLFKLIHLRTPWHWHHDQPKRAIGNLLECFLVIFMDDMLLTRDTYLY